jgi:hypothetical protein
MTRICNPPPHVDIRDREYVETFKASLKKAIFDRESVKIGRGIFYPEELKAVLNALTSLE